MRRQIDVVNERNTKWQLEMRGVLGDDASQQFAWSVMLIKALEMKLQNTFVRMRGLAIVEMAIVVPLFLIMLFGILEFGIVLYDKAIVTNSSLQLAQSGVQMTSTSQALPPSSQEIGKVITAVTSSLAINNVVGNSLLSFGPPSQPNVTALIGGWDGLGYPLTVTVNYSYTSLVLNALVKLLSLANLPNPIPLNATTTMYLN